MTVEELIMKLQEFPSDSVVYTWVPDYGYDEVGAVGDREFEGKDIVLIR